ncbi:putative ssdna binding protein ssb3 protein [Erysiphe necator]|uniref:Putative ssdna binding protein ssb3 protein n=1 Tax=Uncinula necator TaxID=52586 RepID=A0A0B1P3M9_UNCNE|nr:putative ssdna binding protein ssb3 protein [Erysiphe necator]
MAELIYTPRITSSHLDSFTNRTVRLLGRVMQLRGDTAIVDSDGNVTLHLNRDAHLIVGNVFEVIGKINQDLSIRVLKSTNMGKDCKIKNSFPFLSLSLSIHIY